MYKENESLVLRSLRTAISQNSRILVAGINLGSRFDIHLQFPDVAADDVLILNPTKKRAEADLAQIERIIEEEMAGNPEYYDEFKIRWDSNG